MAKYRITSPDGGIYEVNAPDDATQEQVLAYAQQNFAPKPQATPPQQNLGQTASNFTKGLASGAADIGSNLINAATFVPRQFEKLNNAIYGNGTPLNDYNKDRAASLEDFNRDNSGSTAFTLGRIGANVAGSLGAGGAAGTVLRGLSQAPKALQLAEALRTGGFAKDVGTLTNMAGGFGANALGSLLVDPDSAPASATVGVLLPVAGKAAEPVSGYVSSKMNNAAKYLMQSALKPTYEQLKTGKAATAVQTLLDEGINATKGGADKLRSRIDDINGQIKDAIANSDATVDKNKVLDTLAQTKSDFTRQVSPTSDLNAIENVANDFSTHPLMTGNDIPVQLAQDLKQGTYSVLNKKYGQIGSADTEAQKALARGLKEGIAEAVPEVSGLNAQESKLITTLGVTERRALMDMNKNPMGLSLLAKNPAAWAAFMADKSALFKSLAARMVNKTNPVAGVSSAIPAISRTTPALANLLLNPSD